MSSQLDRKRPATHTLHTIYVHLFLWECTWRMNTADEKCWKWNEPNWIFAELDERRCAHVCRLCDSCSRAVFTKIQTWICKTFTSHCDRSFKILKSLGSGISENNREVSCFGEDHCPWVFQNDCEFYYNSFNPPICRSALVFTPGLKITDLYE